MNDTNKDLKLTREEAEKAVALAAEVAAAFMKARLFKSDRDLCAMVRAADPKITSRSLWCALVAGHLSADLPRMNGAFLERTTNRASL